MKRILLVLSVAILSGSLLIGCGEQNISYENAEDSTEAITGAMENRTESTTEIEPDMCVEDEGAIVLTDAEGTVYCITQVHIHMLSTDGEEISLERTGENAEGIVYGDAIVLTSTEGSYGLINAQTGEAIKVSPVVVE